MSRLRLNIDDTQTEIQVDDTTELPTNNGVVLIESEKISYQYATDRAIVGCTRGYDSTTAVSHLAETQVELLTEATSNVSPSELSASGAPTDNLTGVGFAEPGARYTNLDNGEIYINIGTTANPTWTPLATGGGTVPGGPDTSLQFNDLGSFDGSANLVYDSTLNVLTMDGGILQMNSSNYDFTLDPNNGGIAGVQSLVGPVDDTLVISTLPTFDLTLRSASTIIQTDLGGAEHEFVFNASGTLSKVGAFTIVSDTNDIALRPTLGDIILDANTEVAITDDTLPRIAFRSDALALFANIDADSAGLLHLSPQGGTVVNHASELALWLDGGSTLEFRSSDGSTAYGHLNSFSSGSLEVSALEDININNRSSGDPVATFDVNVATQHVVFGPSNLTQYSGAFLTVNGSNATHMATDENLLIHDRTGRVGIEAADDAFAANVPIEFAASDYHFVFSGSERIRFDSHGIYITELDASGSNAQLALNASSPDNAGIFFNESDGSTQKGYIACTNASLSLTQVTGTIDLAPDNGSGNGITNVNGDLIVTGDVTADNVSTFTPAFVGNFTGSPFTTSSTPSDTTITQAFSMSVASHRVKVTVTSDGYIQLGAGNMDTYLAIDGVAVAGSQVTQYGEAAAVNTNCPVSLQWIFTPGDTASHTYSAQYASANNTTNVVFPNINGNMIIEEIL